MEAGYRHSWPLRITAFLLLFALILVVTSVAYGQRRGWWDSTEFQVVNLEPMPARFVARFIDQSGDVAYILTDTLPALGTRFYRPEQMASFPTGFEGTLRIDSRRDIAATILHRANAGEATALSLAGNTFFEVVEAERLGTTAYAPVDLCAIVVIHNMVPTETLGTLDIFSSSGSPLPEFPFSIGPEGSLSRVLDLPGLDGGAYVAADHPVEVTVIDSCTGLAAEPAGAQGVMGLGSYVAPAVPSRVWVAPWVLPPAVDGGGTSHIALKNVTDQEAVVVVNGPNSPLPPITLPGNCGVRVTLPSGSPAGPTLITSTQSIVASVRTQFTLLGEAQEPPGLYSYGAFNPAQATPHVALPVLFDNYDGWTTNNGVYIMNVGVHSTTVTLRYVTENGDRFYDETTLAAGEVWQPGGRNFALAPAAATASADQPIVALVVAKKSGAADGWMAYRGVNYTPRDMRLYYLPTVTRDWPHFTRMRR